MSQSAAAKPMPQRENEADTPSPASADLADHTLPACDIKKVRDRVARAHGQVGGVLRLIDSGASYEQIVHQTMAISKAMNRAALQLMMCCLDHCPELDEDGNPNPERAKLKKMLMTLA